MLSLILLFSIIPTPHIPIDRVSTIELNTVVSEHTGEITLTQLIFWQDGHVVAWECLNHREWRVTWDPPRQEYVLRITDSYSHVLREVRAVQWERTWSYRDREVADRDEWPEVRRRKMWR